MSHNLFVASLCTIVLFKWHRQRADCEVRFFVKEWGRRKVLSLDQLNVEVLHEFLDIWKDSNRAEWLLRLMTIIRVAGRFLEFGDYESRYWLLPSGKKTGITLSLHCAEHSHQLVSRLFQLARLAILTKGLGLLGRHVLFDGLTDVLDDQLLEI